MQRGLVGPRPSGQGRLLAAFFILWAGVGTAHADGSPPVTQQAGPASKMGGSAKGPGPSISSSGRLAAGPREVDRPGVASLPADLKAVIRGVQARYEKLRDFRARFAQESRLETAAEPQLASGEVFFQKPGKMRWNYETPEPQQIVINGGKLWQYVPADRQVVIQSFDTSRVEYAFLTGLGNLEEQFKVRWAEPRKRPGDSLLYVQLVPRDEQASFTKVIIGVEPDGHRILATEVTDFFGNITSIRFKDLRDNVKLGDAPFEFKRPEGVEIIDATAGSQRH